MYIMPRIFNFIKEVHVIGLPDEFWIEAITAFVTPKPGEIVTEEELIALCKSKMVGFKIPQKIVFLNEMPRLVVGKVLEIRN